MSSNTIKQSKNGQYRCTRCGQYKSAGQFYKDDRVPCGIRSRCKSCYHQKSKSLKKRIGWISITERMPENCGMPLLLVGINGYDQKRVFQGFTGYKESGNLIFHSNTRDINIDNWDITHWMPLPEPPEEEKPTEDWTKNKACRDAVVKTFGKKGASK